MPQWFLPLFACGSLFSAFYLLRRNSKKHGWGYFTMKYPEGSEEADHTFTNCAISFGKFSVATEEKNVRIDISKNEISFSIKNVMLENGKNRFTIPRQDVINTEYRHGLLSGKYALIVKNGKRIVVYGKVAGKLRECLGWT